MFYSLKNIDIPMETPLYVALSSFTKILKNNSIIFPQELYTMWLLSRRPLDPPQMNMDTLGR